MLLDEVAAHLDGERRTALFGEILDLGAQAWLTGTDSAVFAELGDAANFFAWRMPMSIRPDPYRPDVYRPGPARDTKSNKPAVGINPPARNPKL